MMKTKIIADLSTNNKSGVKTREVYIRKHYPIDYREIIKIDFVKNWNEKLFCYNNRLTKIPTCVNPDCNNKVRFNGYGKGYYKYCSVSCRNRDTDLKLVGDKNPMKNNENVVKAKKTKKEKYGDENYVNSIRAKKTKKEKYGDENFNNRNKFKKTTFELYGKEGFTNRKKAIQTNLERYGIKFYNNREKAIQTNLKRYGVEQYMESNDFREKSISTNKLIYGVEHYTQSNEYKNRQYLKTQNKWLEKMGINNIKYDGNEFIISNYCDKHISFKINKYVLRNRLNYGIKDICTICNPVNEHSSIKENEIVEFIDSLNINYERNERVILGGKEIDIYLPDHKIGVEFNGLYWHSDLFVDNNYHLNKTEACKNNGIQLLHVFEDEWINKQEIVKSIIKSKLNIYDEKIFGRKTEVKEIHDNKLVRKFLETNHIQGFVGSKFKIGLYYDNELVSLMTFGKKRVSMGNKSSEDNEYEMLRYCNKLNTVVIGGAGKLLKYFIITYQPKSILTFADRRYSNGNLYQELGFDYIGNSRPNYWYFKIHEYHRYYRFGFRKDVLVKEEHDPNKTERQIMIDRGYLRIYDCGNLKYILKSE